MLYFYPRLYVGDKVKNATEIVDRLNAGSAVYGIFVLCVAPGQRQLLEIFHSTQLFGGLFGQKPYTIVGIADGYEEARQLFVRILQEYIHAGGKLQRFGAHFCTGWEVRP